MTDLLAASSDTLPPITTLPSTTRLTPALSVNGLALANQPSVTRSTTAAFPTNPPLIRNVSASRGMPSANPTTSGGGMAGDWRTSISVEERLQSRKRLREAYSKQCSDYQSLLDTVIAVEEELIFAAANNRLDYFKTGIDWEARLKLKKQQLSGQCGDSKKRSLDDTQSILPLVAANGEAGTPSASAASANSVPVPAPIMTSSDHLFPSAASTPSNSSGSSGFATSPSSAFRTTTVGSAPLSPADKKDSGLDKQLEKEKVTVKKQKV